MIKAAFCSETRRVGGVKFLSEIQTNKIEQDYNGNKQDNQHKYLKLLICKE